MKVKKYIANTMPEAMRVIRKELGKEAVILQTREIKQKGLFGFFQKKKIEVIAAKDPEPVQQEEKRPVPEAMLNELPLEPSVERREEKFEQMILQEIKGLKKIVKLEKQSADATLSLDYQPALHHLHEQEVDPELALSLVEQTSSQFEKQVESPSQTEIYQKLQQIISENLSELSFQGITDNHKIIQFIGPTGVGKTTTIAKVAAQLLLDNKKKVAFITTDTYRIAAIEQLKTYARILNVPLEVAYNVTDFEQAINKLADYDHILVDTAGRNFRNPTYIDQLKEMMGDVPEISNYLVLSLTAKQKDMEAVFEKFKRIPLSRLIFTKMDETTSYGGILTFALKHRVGVAYLTNGQDVPDDLLEPSAQSISELIVRDSYD